MASRGVYFLLHLIVFWNTSKVCNKQLERILKWGLTIEVLLIKIDNNKHDSGREKYRWANELCKYCTTWVANL